MKIRNGFVSNSSSSSFVCDVCGETFSAMYLCLSEADMFKCENGHTICNSHKLIGDNKEYTEYTDAEKIELLKKWYKEIDEDQPKSFKYLNEYWEEYLEYINDETDDGNYDVEEKYCPCCNFTEITKDDAIAFYISTTGKSFKDICKEIKLNCNSYAAFEKKYEKE